MKTKTLKVALVVGVLVATLSSLVMAASVQVVDLGARYHVEHSAFLDLPYTDGDMTYCLGYEIHDNNALLQLVCGYTPEFSDHENLGYGITPEANLLMKDGMLQGGLGILSTYTEEPGEWMDMYYQFVLGLNVPLGKNLSIQANAYYVFGEWDAIGDFDVGDIEFGGYLGYKF